MKDSTAVSESFVVFSCDNHAIAGAVICSTADELAAWLSSQAGFFDLPSGLYWGRLARRAFRGRVIFFPGRRGGQLLFRSEGVLTFRESDGRLVQSDTDYWTLADHEAAVAEFDAARSS